MVNNIDFSILQNICNSGSNMSSSIYFEDIKKNPKTTKNNSLSVISSEIILDKYVSNKYKEK